MRISQLDHVAIHVADVTVAADFYERVLRLARIPRPSFDFPGAWFRLGEAQELHLIGDRVEPVKSHNRGTHFALMVDDMDAWERHLQSQGVDYRPRKLRPDGAEQIFLVDPDGHYVELCHVAT